MPNLGYDPTLTQNAAGTFNTDSSGYIQGFEQDNPTVWQMLSGGVVDAAETLPMFGGVAIGEKVPQGIVQGSSTGPKALGGYIARSNGVAGTVPLTGFTVYNKTHHALSSPSSQAPLLFAGQNVHFYRLGSNARIPVACDAALVSLNNGFISAQVSWDFYGQRLVPYKASYADNVLTAATWASTNGGQATFTTTSSHGLSPGDDVSISGVTPTAYNGSYTAITGTTGSTIVVALPLASTPGAGTTFGKLVAGGGALPCKVLDVSATNCMTINFDPVSGTASWNRNGSCALILI